MSIGRATIELVLCYVSKQVKVTPGSGPWLWRPSRIG